MGTNFGLQSVAVMTGQVESKFLFFRTFSEKWENLTPHEAMKFFEAKFLAFPHKMVVVEPAFEKLPPQKNLHFHYLIDEESQLAGRERKIFNLCLQRLTSENEAEVAYIKADAYDHVSAISGELIWNGSNEEIAQKAALTTKKSCCDHLQKLLLPNAHRFGANKGEGGIYTPFKQEGLFRISMI